MPKKLTIVVAVLTVLIVASVPALAQLGPGEDSSYSYWVYSPETGEHIDCRIVNRESAAFDVCLENGIKPPVAYTVAPDGGIVSTPVAPPGYTPEEVDREIRAQIQYDNA